MVWPNRKNNCGRIRQWLADTLTQQLDFTTAWTQRHIATCPSCRRQIAGNSRLRLALMLIKTQPHSRDLLMHANRRAIKLLARGLQDSPQAHKLRHIRPQPTIYQKLSKYTQSITHAAACLLILVLLRTGILSSLSRINDQGERFVEQHYNRYMDLARNDGTPSDLA